MPSAPTSHRSPPLPTNSVDPPPTASPSRATQRVEGKSTYFARPGPAPIADVDPFSDDVDEDDEGEAADADATTLGADALRVGPHDAIERQRPKEKPTSDAMDRTPSNLR